MRHLDYTAAFEQLAIQSKKIAHTKEGRNAFFRINDLEELNDAIAVDNDLSFPCMVLSPYWGLITGADHANDEMTAFFEIRTNTEVLNYDDIDAARDECKQIGMMIIKKIRRDLEDNPCGPFQDFDFKSVQYHFTGPSGVNEYGCLFRFNFGNEAFDPYSDEDLDEAFF